MSDAWDPSIVDFAAPADGFLTRAFGGRSGPTALENGAVLSFPFKRQMQAAAAPGVIYGEDFGSGTYVALSLDGPNLTAGGVQSELQLRSIAATGADARMAVGGNYVGITETTATLIAATGSSATLQAETCSLVLNGSDGSDAVLFAPDAITIFNDPTTGTTIDIDSNGALNLVGAPVNINGVDVSTGLTWTTFTSGLIQSGAPTFTATYCKYSKQGRTVTVSMLLSVTATGSAVAGNRVQITLPFTAVQAGSHCAGAGFIVGAGTHRPGHVLFPSTTTAALSPSSVDGGGYLGANHWTGVLTTNDVVSMTFTYEATT